MFSTFFFVKLIKDNQGFLKISGQWRRSAGVVDADDGYESAGYVFAETTLIFSSRQFPMISSVTKLLYGIK